jgi:hypothetical protein
VDGAVRARVQGARLVVNNGGFTMPEVEKRYRQFVEETWGELDIPRLCEVMVSFGGRLTLDASREFSDIGPMLQRVDERVHRLLELWQRMAADERDHRAYEWALSNAAAEERAIVMPDQEELPF